MEMIGALVLFLIVAIAAPFLGHDSRPVDADRHIRWWPGEPRLADGPITTTRDARPQRTHQLPGGAGLPRAA